LLLRGAISAIWSREPAGQPAPQTQTSTQAQAQAQVPAR